MYRILARWCGYHVTRRLRDLGYEVDDRADALSEEITSDDVRLINVDLRHPGPAAVSRRRRRSRSQVVIRLGRRDPWLEADEEVPPLHLLRAAIALDRTVDEVAERLGQLGFRVCPVREFSSPGAYLRAMEEHAARLAEEAPPGPAGAEPEDAAEES